MHEIKKIVAPIIIIILLILAKIDGGWALLIIISSIFIALIVGELTFLRGTLLSAMADGVSDNKIVRFILEQRCFNLILALIGAIWLSFHLIAYVYLCSWNRFCFLCFAPLIYPYMRGIAISDNIVKKKISKVLSRLMIIISLSLFFMFIDGIIQMFLEIDSRISMPLDVNIPQYVNETVWHSTKLFRWYLRIVQFVNMNLDSLLLSEDANTVFIIVRFILGFNMAPFISIFLMLFGLDSIKKFNVNIEVER